MKQRSSIYYTETDKALMWDHWQQGESLNSIARLFDRHHSAIRGVLARTGGIRPFEGVVELRYANVWPERHQQILQMQPQPGNRVKWLVVQNSSSFMWTGVAQWSRHVRPGNAPDEFRL